MSNIRLLKGDCLQKLKELEDNSVDSVVTDPPYEIGFMGKGWDDSGIANNPELWKEVLRVLKPGGHLLSFSHSRTYHRQAVAVEDAGFEIRDQIMWIYGSGFPKSHNIGKAVDKLQGNEREVVGKNVSIQIREKGLNVNKEYGQSDGMFGKYGHNIDVTKGNSPYEGWGTALKPAHEPIVMARKPFKGSVAQNVLEWGTGGINVDGCRIDNSDMKVPDNANEIQTDKPKHHSGAMTGTIGKMQVHNDGGRFPANIIFDEEAGKILDEQTGEVGNGWKKNYGKEDYNGKQYDSSTNQCKHGGGYTGKNTYVDSGGASRFFYCPKASKKDRNEGNIHPTVKPTDLMAYLVRLVTPKGGTVLDPFMGSGSTGKASVREGMDFIGIEREDEYMEIAKTRIEHEQSKHNHRKFFDV